MIANLQIFYDILYYDLIKSKIKKVTRFKTNTTDVI